MLISNYNWLIESWKFRSNISSSSIFFPPPHPRKNTDKPVMEMNKFGISEFASISNK